MQASIILTVPVIIKPVLVSVLINIFLFSSAVCPSLSLTDFSQSLRYVKNTFSNHYNNIIIIIIFSAKMNKNAYLKSEISSRAIWV